MKRILAVFSTLALALALGAPAFAARAPKAQSDTMAKTTKSHAKHHKMSKKSGKKSKSKSGTPKSK